MKNIIACFTLLILSITAFAQQEKPAQPYTQQEYLKKSKSQKTAAWVLTAAGTGGLIGTLLADAGQAMEGVLITVVSLGSMEPEYKSYTGAYLVSAAAVAGGITLFIAGAKNKQKAKAATVLLKMGKAPVLHQATIANFSYPSIGIKVNL